jgi:hypothetical protein
VTVERVLPPAQRVAGGRDRVVLDVGAAGGGSADPGPAAHQRRRGPRGTRRHPRGQPHRRAGERGVARSGGLPPRAPSLDALRAAGGLKQDTYLGRVLVTRFERDSSRVQLRAVLRDLAGNVYNDLDLRPDDEIEVFSVATFRPDRSVSVGGAVREAGRFRTARACRSATSCYSPAA